MNIEKVIEHLTDAKNFVGSISDNCKIGSIPYYVESCTKSIDRALQEVKKEEKPIEGLTQIVYDALVCHCEGKMNGFGGFMMRDEHRIFLELLKRVGYKYIEKED